MRSCIRAAPPSIRALGGLPQPCDFGPPSPELVHAIVTGTSPTLLALDREEVMT